MGKHQLLTPKRVHFLKSAINNRGELRLITPEGYHLPPYWIAGTCRLPLESGKRLLKAGYTQKAEPWMTEPGVFRFTVTESGRSAVLQHSTNLIGFPFRRVV